MNDKRMRAPSTESAPQNIQLNNSIYQSVKLTSIEYTEIEKLIPASSKQFKRMVKHLAEHPNSLTTKVCVACASVNLSDLARKHNHLIKTAGLFVGCCKPPFRTNNRFGEPSNEHLWGLYRIEGTE